MTAALPRTLTLPIPDALLQPILLPDEGSPTVHRSPHHCKQRPAISRNGSGTQRTAGASCVRDPKRQALRQHSINVIPKLPNVGSREILPSPLLADRKHSSPVRFPSFARHTQSVAR